MQGGVLLAAVLLAAAGLLSAVAGRLALGLARTSDSSPVAIDLLVVDARPDTLRVVPGVVYRIDQIDLVATDRRAEDDGLHALMNESAFAELNWQGLRLAFSDTARGLDGLPFLREIYRDAGWMTGAHRFTVTPRDADGDPAGTPILLKSDADRRGIPSDDFPIRRPAVIRDHRDGLYQAEALLQLRNASSTEASANETFLMTADIRALDLVWQSPASGTEPGAHLHYLIPVVPVSDPLFAYGFRCELELVDPPPNGQYAPGKAVEVAVTFRDGAGQRLHPPGSLPTYNEFRRGLASGLRYYDFYPSILFFKDKNKEGVMLFALFGPEERARQIYSEVPAEQFEQPQQVVAETQRDGYACIWQGIPPANVLFAGLADSTAWDSPIADRIRFQIPADALPGRYQVIGKARRAFLGESSLVTAAVRFEVIRPELTEDHATGAGGTSTRSAPAAALKHDGPFAVCPLPAVGMEKTPAGLSPLADDLQWVGKCKDCHADGFQLGSLLHANGDWKSCAGCHAPMVFEPDNMLAYRVHYLHNFSPRYHGGAKNCAACHYRPESVERESLLVCLSCHITYHGGAEHFGNYQSCSFSKCHDGAHNQF